MSADSSAYPERQRRSSREEVRRRVLDAARREFAARGFDGVSLDQIAAAAGFSKGAVYSNFSDKSDLFLALMDESVSARLSAARSAGAAGPGQHDKELARRVGDRLIEQFAAADDDWQLLLLEFWMRALRDPSMRAPFVEYRRRFRQAIAEEFERLFPGGDPELASIDIATTILALIHGLAMERMLDPDAGSDALLGISLNRLVPRPG
jgi:AcrR family transcriptional regulator